MDKKFLTQTEAQNYTGFKRTFLWQLRKLHRVKYYKVGRKTFYLKASLDELILNSQVIPSHIKTYTDENT